MPSSGAPEAGLRPRRQTRAARRWTALLLTAGCALRVPPGPAPVAIAAQPVTPVVLPDPATDRVWFAARLATGAADDPPGREGLAALAVRARVAATARADAAPIEVEIGRDWTELRLACPSADALPCADRFANALVGDGAPVASDLVAALQVEAVRRLDAIPSDPTAMATAVLGRVLWHAHPYGHPVDGRRTIVPLLTADEATAFAARHLVRTGVRVGLAGTFPPEAAARLADRLSALPTSLPVDRPLPTPLRQPGPGLWVVPAAVTETTVVLGATWSRAAGDPPPEGALAACAYLGGGAPGLRPVALDPLPTAHGGWAFALPVQDAASATEALAQALEALGRLQRDGIPADALADARAAAAHHADPAALLRDALGRTASAPSTDADLTAAWQRQFTLDAVQVVVITPAPDAIALPPAWTSGQRTVLDANRLLD